MNLNFYEVHAYRTHVALETQTLHKQKQGLKFVITTRLCGRDAMSYMGIRSKSSGRIKAYLVMSVPDSYESRLHLSLRLALNNRVQFQDKN